MTDPVGYETIAITRQPLATRITLNRPEAQNSITPTMLTELGAALKAAATDASCRLIVLDASGPAFCVGMDVSSAATSRPDEVGGEAFYGLLHRLSTHPKVVVAAVAGRVVGGGVGLAAACDYVWATPDSSFALPELLWGLLPCCVLPFLILRCGMQFARSMTLSTLPVDATLAWQRGLVDQLMPDFDAALRALSYRLSKVDPRTVRAGKEYLRKLWVLDERTEQIVISEFATLMSSDVVAERLGDFAATRRAPWEART